MPPDLSTQRLRLRPWHLDDVEFFVAMDMDPDVGRYLYPHGPPVEAERRAEMQQRISQGQPDQGCIWTVEWAESGKRLGRCGVHPLRDSDLIEIGYRYITAAWGNGVATEAAERVLDYGFRDFNFDPIVGVTHPDNAGSQRVLQKIGLRPGGLQFHYGLDLSFFSLGRAEFLTSR